MFENDNGLASKHLLQVYEDNINKIKGINNLYFQIIWNHKNPLFQEKMFEIIKSCQFSRTLFC